MLKWLAPAPPPSNSMPCMAAGKAAGDDKKLGKILERQYASEAAAGAGGSGGPDAGAPKSPLITSTPLGDLSEAPTRRLLINLISTLNASFPDYDFR